MSSSNNWELVFLLHNLESKEAFESEFIAIVPHDDVRLTEIRSRVSSIEPLIRNFTDQFGVQAHPSALIIRRDAPSRIRTLEAIVSFRNVFALSCLLYGWPRTIGSLNVFFPLWSDFFDFYPTCLAKDANFLHTLSPAVNGANKPQKFRGQVSPGLPKSAHLRFRPDDRILPPLLYVWTREFRNAKPSGWKTRALFRSLEMAYQAASVPTRNRSTIYDFGSHIGLWVSAFEVLIHPGRKRPGGKTEKADIEKVTKLLKDAKWQNYRLRRGAYRILIERNKPKVRVNLVQKLYRELYDARNDFLHGNPVTISRLFPFRNKSRPSLIQIAPLVYKVALSCFLEKCRDRKGKQGQQPNWKDVFDRRALEKALLSTLEDRNE